MFVRRGFTFVQGGLAFKFDKNSANLWCFIFQFGDGTDEDATLDFSPNYFIF